MWRGLPTVPLVRKTLGVAFALAICALVPSSSAASCGDWISEAAGHGGELASPLPVLPIADDEPPMGGCRGPFCDRDPSERPSLPPVPVVEAGPDHLACLLHAPAVTAPQRHSDGQGETGAAPRYVPFVPDRPPRG